MSTPLTRIRLWHRRWFWLLNAVGVLLIAWWWIQSDSPIAKLRAAGEPTCYADLVAEPIPDEENVAAGLRDLNRALEQGESAVSEALDLLDRPPLDERSVEQARIVFEQQSETFAELHRVLERPRYASLLEAQQIAATTPLLNTSSTLRSVARYLMLESRVALAAGRLDDAVVPAIALARLGKLSESEPLLMSRPVAIVVQICTVDSCGIFLENGRLPREIAEQLDAAIAPLEDRSGLAQNLRTERAFALEELEALPLPMRIWERGPVLRVFEEAIAEAEKQFAEPGPGGSFTSPMSLSAMAPLLAQSIEGVWDAENLIARETQELRRKLAEASQ